MAIIIPYLYLLVLSVCQDLRRETMRNGCTLFLSFSCYLIPLSLLTFPSLFLPRDASAERGDATVSRLSVCLSVCPSVTIIQVPCSNTLEFFENNFTAE